MDGKTGLSAAINMAAVCENELGMIVLGVGSLPEPGANPTLDCAVELAGEHLLYSIALKRTGVYLAAAPLDGDGVLETIVRFNDTANDWATLQRLVGALGCLGCLGCLLLAFQSRLPRAGLARRLGLIRGAS
jgi:hypothetical protein